MEVYRPPGVSLIAIWDFIGAMASFMMAFVLQTDVEPWLKLVLLTSMVLNLVVGYGLWNLYEWARQAHIGLAAFGIIAVMAMYFVDSTMMGLIPAVVTILIYGAIIWYLTRYEVAVNFR